MIAAVRRTGLVPRGALLLEESERVGELSDIRTIVLAGLVGREGWSAFAASPEANDGLRRSTRPLEPATDRGARARTRRASAVSVWRPALLAVPAMGAARRTRSSLADRPSDSSALRPLAFLPRSAWLPRRARRIRASGRTEPLRILQGTVVLENVPGRRVFRGGLRCRRLRWLPENPCGRRLHGRRVPRPSSVSGGRGPRLRPRTGQFLYARVLARAGQVRSSEAAGARGSHPCPLGRRRSCGFAAVVKSRMIGREIDELHDGPMPAPRVTRSSSSCANVSVIPPSIPAMERSRASFVG